MIRGPISRSSRRSRWGAVTVEMALVLPIFTTLVFGIIEFGRGFMIGQLVTNAAREGARQAIVDGSTNSAVSTSVKTFMQQSAGVATGNTTVLITITPDTGNPAVSDVSTAKPKDLVTVKVSVPFDSVALISGKFMNGKTLSGTASMRHE